MEDSDKLASRRMRSVINLFFARSCYASIINYNNHARSIKGRWRPRQNLFLPIHLTSLSSAIRNPSSAMRLATSTNTSEIHLSASVSALPEFDTTF